MSTAEDGSFRCCGTLISFLPVASSGSYKVSVHLLSRIVVPCIVWLEQYSELY